MILSKGDQDALESLRILGVADGRVGRLAGILCKIVAYLEERERANREAGD